MPRATDLSRPSRLLTGGLVAVLVTGLVLVLVPAVGRVGFGMLVYGREGFGPGFAGEPASYVRLVHGVLGAVMAGWAVLLLWLARVALPQGVPGAWAALTGSVVGWYVVDTVHSLVSGAPENALLNTAFLLVLLPGIAVTRPGRRRAEGAVRRS